MKFSIEKEQFLSALGIAVRGASTRSAIQTLAGVMLQVEPGSVELQATDMELGVRIRAEADVEREGAAVVPARLLLDVVRSLPKSEVSLEYRASQGDVELVSGPSRFHLRTLPADEFPRLPEVGDATVMKLPSPAFVETVTRVARAASLGADYSRRAGQGNASASGWSAGCKEPLRMSGYGARRRPAMLRGTASRYKNNSRPSAGAEGSVRTCHRGRKPRFQDERGRQSGRRLPKCRRGLRR